MACILTGEADATAADGLAWVRRITRELDIPPLGAYGIGQGDVPVLVEKASKASSMKANPIVLEPIVNIDVTVPQANMGDITGDLSSKRGRISGTSTGSGGMLTISGQVPLSELDSYQSELKSVTGGAGSYSMEFSHYDPVPPVIQKQLADEFKPAADED